MLRVVVDNTAGGDPHLARDLMDRLGAQGFDVELRAPAAGAMFDTAVHTVSTGIVLRVAQRPAEADLAALQDVVRAALMERPSLRRRARAIPLHVEGSPR